MKSPVCYFFGVWRHGVAGHHLHRPDGSTVYERHVLDSLPFRWETVDGGLLHQPEIQGRLHLAVINKCTVLGMWDRTGDERPGSNASVIAFGEFNENEMLEIFRDNFPDQYARILNQKPKPQ